MARHKIHSAYHPLILFVLLLFLVLSHQVLLSKFLSQRSSRQVYIDGRWKTVRSSLGLPPLSDTILFTRPSHTRIPATARLARFDLKRKRSEYDTIDEPAQLYFSPDALHEPSISHERLLESLHAITVSEKENAAYQRKTSAHQGQRNQRPPSSWTTQERKRTDDGGGQ